MADAAGIEFYVEKSGINAMTSRLFEEAGLDIYSSPDSPLPILQASDILRRKIPQLLRNIDGDYRTLLIPSYTMLAGIEPQKFDSDIAVYVHDLWDFFHTDSLLSKLNVEAAIHSIEDCDRVIANSETTRTVVHNTVCDSKDISVVRYGIDTNIFNKKREGVYDGSLPERYLLYVGGFMDRKNEIFLIDVLQHLEDWRLVVAGDSYSGERAEEFIQYAEDKGVRTRVHRTGWLNTDELRRVYKEAEVYLHPARSGGYEMPPVEAAACGTPVVIYNQIPAAEDLSEVADTFSRFDAEKVAKMVQKREGDSVDHTPRTVEDAGENLRESLGL